MRLLMEAFEFAKVDILFQQAGYGVVRIAVSIVDDLRPTGFFQRRNFFSTNGMHAYYNDYIYP